MMKNYSLKVMAEFCASGLWDRNNGGCGVTMGDFLQETDEVKKLDNDLENWFDKYTEGCWHDKPSPDFDWDVFHKEGIELAKRVKKLMGPNGTVIYLKISDYPWDQSSVEIIIED
jgi:hypothetical protein